MLALAGEVWVQTAEALSTLPRFVDGVPEGAHARQLLRVHEELAVTRGEDALGAVVAAEPFAFASEACRSDGLRQISLARTKEGDPRSWSEYLACTAVIVRPHG